MGSPSGELQDLFAEMTAAWGEDAVRRALRLTPVLSVVRDDADFNLDTASRAAAHPAAWGTLVLELPASSSDPVEATWLSNTHLTPKPVIDLAPKQKRNRNAS